MCSGRKERECGEAILTLLKEEKGELVIGGRLERRRERSIGIKVLGLTVYE